MKLSTSNWFVEIPVSKWLWRLAWLACIFWACLPWDSEALCLELIPRFAHGHPAGNRSSRTLADAQLYLGNLVWPLCVSAEEHQARGLTAGDVSPRSSRKCIFCVYLIRYWYAAQGSVRPCDPRERGAGFPFQEREIIKCQALMKGLSFVRSAGLPGEGWWALWQESNCFSRILVHSWFILQIR